MILIKLDSLRGKKGKHVFLTTIFMLAFLFSGCVAQDFRPLPKNYSPDNSTITLPLNITNQINSTNQTEVPPQTPILLPITKGVGVYIIDTERKGSYIITLGGKGMLINPQGGSDVLRILKIAKNLGISKLDSLLITNNYEDNIAGASSIILRLKPLQLIHSGIPSPSYRYQQYVMLYPNSTIVPHDTVLELGESTIDLIVPYDDGSSITDDNSIVAKLDYGSTSILFLTDCEIDCESRINNVESQILVSNGGCDSLSLVFLQESNPELVIFSSKPCYETLNRVKDNGIDYLSTDIDGDIVISSEGRDYQVSHLKVK